MIPQEMSLKDRAYQEIKERIVTGQWEGGTFLSEKYLSELLEMSKTPIRSALDRLEMAGLVKLAPKQGIVVQEISMRKTMEIFEIRLPLECYAVRRLTGRLGAELIQKLEGNLAEQHLAVNDKDLARYVYLDKIFHELIIGGLDNEEFNEVMSRIQDKFRMVVLSIVRKETDRLWVSTNEHEKIVEALKGNDPDVSENLIKEHFEYGKQIMIR